MNRPKFKKLDQGKVKELLSRLRSEAHRVDPEDNKFLECAVEAEADFLITGNTKHFPPGKFQETVILNPTQFLPVAAGMLDL
ncbi:MAG: PIN domain-containing protein [Syntrophobacteraceae bacterium]